MRTSVFSAARVEAAYRALVLTCQRNQWFKLLERLNHKVNRLPAPHWGQVQDFPDWPAFLAKLAADAKAAAPAVEQRS